MIPKTNLSLSQLESRQILEIQLLKQNSQNITGPLKQRNDIADRNKGIYHMLSNKTGKPRKVQIQLLYTPGQKGGWGGEESLSNLRTCKQRNCKILNCKAKETHLIPQEFKYVFQLGYPIPQKDIERHKNLQTYNISTVRL